jgi:hypothetical protein
MSIVIDEWRDLSILHLREIDVNQDGMISNIRLDLDRWLTKNPDILA